MHPEGWLSSAYYVAVPPEVNEPGRAGWIQFGAPRFPVPGAEAAHFGLQPQAGRLVLFPSYMWHGTVPISGAAPRMTVAFDALPS